MCNKTLRLLITVLYITSSAPSSLHACNLKLAAPAEAITCPSLRESQEQCGNTTSPYPTSSRANLRYCEYQGAEFQVVSNTVWDTVISGGTITLCYGYNNK